jgi:hypothetical protein
MKTAEKETRAMKEKDKTATQIAQQMMENYEKAVHSGLHIQEEALKCCNRVFSQTAMYQEWQKRLGSFTDATNGFLPEAQKRAEEMLDLMDKNARTGAELMKKAVDAAQTPGITDSQAKWMDFWTTSLGALQDNTSAMAQIHGRALDCFMEMARQNVEAAAMSSDRRGGASAA